MTWDDVVETAERWLPRAEAVHRATAPHVGRLVLASVDAGLYLEPEVGVVAAYAGRREDALEVKAAAELALPRRYVRAAPLSIDELADGPWTKVAYSAFLRSAGEALNFLPGQLPGGLPNAPSPLAAMLTTGLVGAGLGYGLGQVGKRLLPQGYGEKLPRSGALLGGLLGVSPGAAWAAYNAAAGRSPLDPYPLDVRPDDPVADGPDPGPLPAIAPLFETIPEQTPAWFGPAAARALHKLGAEGVFVRAPAGPGPADVHVDSLNRLVWETADEDPGSAATAAAATWAAGRQPTAAPISGWVTGDQFGRLAAGAGQGYLTGLLVGAALNKIVGTPYSAPALGLGGAAIGVAGALAGRLFGG